MRKLNNDRGATLLMALLLLLVASMVSVVILSAATTSARHLETDRAAQQAYLTVSSAAQLLRNDIAASSFRQETVRTTYFNGITEEKVSPAVLQSPGVMADWLTAGKDAVDRGRPFTDTVTLSLPVTAGVADVTAQFTMDESYDITVLLSLADGGDADCRLVLTLREDRAAPSVTTVSGTGWFVSSVTTTTMTLSWSLSGAQIGKEAVVSES